MYSNLVEYINISPNTSGYRKRNIKGIAIHHAAGNISIEGLGNIFANPDREASSTYGIDSDGRIGCYLEEEYRPYTTGDVIDEELITIEVANCEGEPTWRISEKAMNSLIKLCADICRRYGISPTYDGTKEGSNIHLHRWYQATLCPGPYIVDNMNYIVDSIINLLNYTGWMKEDNEWYYYKDGNIVKSQWILYKDEWYYLGDDGIMFHDTWFKYKDRWTYLDSNGVALLNSWGYLEWEYSKDWYFFDSDGYMLRDTWVYHDGIAYWVGSDGIWIDKPTWKCDGSPIDGYPFYEY